MTVLVVSTWHTRAELLVQQLRTYDAAFGGDLVHCVNINQDFEKHFFYGALKRGIDFKRIPNLIFTSPGMRTCYGGIAHAWFHGVFEAMRRGIAFDHIYFHTSADLMIRRGMAQHIRQYDIGAGLGRGMPFTIVEDPAPGGPYLDFGRPLKSWFTAMVADPRVPGVLQALGMTKFHKHRAEGSFYRREIFFEAMAPLLAQISLPQMAAIDPVYPIEEFLFANCVEAYCARHRIRRTRQAVTVSAGLHEQAGIAEIDQALGMEGVFGIKRFPTDPEAPERQYVLHHLGMG